MILITKLRELTDSHKFKIRNILTLTEQKKRVKKLVYIDDFSQNKKGTNFLDSSRRRMNPVCAMVLQKKKMTVTARSLKLV